jgi:hypothetical protein
MGRAAQVRATEGQRQRRAAAAPMRAGRTRAKAWFRGGGGLWRRFGGVGQRGSGKNYLRQSGGRVAIVGRTGKI